MILESGIIFLWFVRNIRQFLFYLYLWQLKEYHLGRFLAHFKTAKAKRAVFNKLLIIKLFLLVVFFLWFRLAVFLLFIVYLLEALKFLRDARKKQVPKPVFTIKALFLLLAVFLFQIVFLIIALWGAESPLVYLLIFDLLALVVVSFVVLSFQPFVSLLRTGILTKARKKREKFKNLKVIGITGSFGKTSTKEFLTEILSEKFNVLKTPEHKNSEMGISQTILQELNYEHDIFVCEMGAYNKGGIKLLCNIAKPDIGILTGVNEQHLGLFGSIENLISAEGGGELLESLPHNGLMVFNGNNKQSLTLYKRAKIRRNICFSKNRDKRMKNALWAEDIKTQESFIFFDICSSGKECFSFKANVLGRHNVSNLLLAVSAARELGMTIGEIQRAALKIKPNQGGLSLFKKGKDLKIIDASYSLNPDGALALLDYLSIFPAKKVLIMPCLIELGSASPKIHRKIGEKIGEVCDLCIVTARDCFEEIKQGAKKNKANIFFIEEPEKALSKLNDFCKGTGVILVMGRVSEEIIEGLKIKINKKIL